jgi:hypothetical protein
VPPRSHSFKKLKKFVENSTSGTAILSTVKNIYYLLQNVHFITKYFNIVAGMIQIFKIYNCAKMFTFYSACILEHFLTVSRG